MSANFSSRADDTALLGECHEKLGEATQKEAQAGKKAIETEKEHQALTDIVPCAAERRRYIFSLLSVLILL